MYLSEYYSCYLGSFVCLDNLVVTTSGHHAIINVCTQNYLQICQIFCYQAIYRSPDEGVIFGIEAKRKDEPSE